MQGLHRTFQSLSLRRIDLAGFARRLTADYYGKRHDRLLAKSDYRRQAKMMLTSLARAYSASISI